MLRNWILGFLAIALWTTNYFVYFAQDIRAPRRRPQPHPASPREERPASGLTGPLPAHERQPFPRPERPAVKDAEIIPFPDRRRGNRGAAPDRTGLPRAD